MTQNVYERLAKHISKMAMGLPFRQGLLELLQETYTPVEAEAVLLLPINGNPLKSFALDELSTPDGTDRKQLETTMKDLTSRGLIFSRKLENGQTGYALHQFGFGFPQTYFWKGEDTPHGRKMSQLMRTYLNTKATREVLEKPTNKPWRYIPINKALKPDTQAVYTSHMMEAVLANATMFAVAQQQNSRTIPANIPRRFASNSTSWPNLSSTKAWPEKYPGRKRGRLLLNVRMKGWSALSITPTGRLNITVTVAGVLVGM